MSNLHIQENSSFMFQIIPQSELLVKEQDTQKALQEARYQLWKTTGATVLGGLAIIGAIYGVALATGCVFLGMMQHALDSYYWDIPRSVASALINGSIGLAFASLGVGVVIGKYLPKIISNIQEKRQIVAKLEEQMKAIETQKLAILVAYSRGQG